MAVIVGLGLGLGALLAAAPARAADPCAALPPYTPEVKTELQSKVPDLGNDIPYETVQRMVGASKAVLLGVTLISREARHDYKAEPAESPDGGVCLALSRLTLRMVHTMLAIQIANHVHPGSCTYDVTMEHERGHVAYERGAVKKALFELRKEIEQPMGYFHGADTDAAIAALEAQVTRWSRKLKARADKVAKRGHGYLDIQSNIRGALARCPRWQRK